MSVTLSLIGFTVVISLLALYAVPQLYKIGMMIPYRMVREKTWYEFVTSGFLHAGIGHLFLNMFVLFFFGLVVERNISQLQFILLYFSALTVSGIPSVYKHKDDPEYATLGASGAVESVLFAYIMIYPLEPIYIMFIPIGIPSIIFGVLFLAYSIYASKKEGRINHEAHIAGAVWGILYMLLFVRGSLDHFLSVFGLI